MFRLIVTNYEVNKHYQIEEDVDFAKVVFASDSRIRKIDECHVIASFTRFEEAFDIELKIKGTLTAVCSYTLEEFPFKFSFKERISARDDDEGDYKIVNNFIDLDNVILALIDSYVPLNVTKPGAKKPTDGEGYRVLSEEELLEERKSAKDPRWAALDDIELD